MSISLSLPLSLSLSPALQVHPVEMEEQGQLKALLRWRRLSDELQHSQEELQVLRWGFQSFNNS